jgi:hypothetical protein
VRAPEDKNKFDEKWKRKRGEMKPAFAQSVSVFTVEVLRLFY